MSAAAALETRLVDHEPPPGVELLRHYLRDLVYGANDGIITTFAVVSEMLAVGALAAAVSYGVGWLIAGVT